MATLDSRTFLPVPENPTEAELQARAAAAYLYAAQNAPEPESFACPECRTANWLVAGIPEQRCTACGCFHKTTMLLVEGWCL
jgi:hypothetical protein